MKMQPYIFKIDIVKNEISKFKPDSMIVCKDYNTWNLLTFMHLLLQLIEIEHNFYH